MQKFFTVCFSLIFCLSYTIGWTNNLNLVNDSSYVLTVTIYDANENLLTEMVLNPYDTQQWSDNVEGLYTENYTYRPQPPYTVNWYCSQGSSFSSCDNVSSGSYVTAQGCMGNQQCAGTSQP